MSRAALEADGANLASEDRSPKNKPITLFLGTLLLMVVVLFPVAFRQRHYQILDDSFFVNKLRQQPNYDIVAVGDSRVYRGIDPSELEKRFPGEKGYNFGFSGLRLCTDILNDAEKLLRPDGQRTLIIAISAPSMAKGNQDGYQTLRKLNGLERWNLLHFGKYEKYLKLYAGTNANYVQYPKVDGFVWSDFRKRDLGSYRAESANDPLLKTFDTVRVQQIADWISGAVQRGIKVYVTTTPVSKQTADFEQVAGYSESYCVDKLTHAGGIWIKPQGQYETYDGSHLIGGDADRFSQDLASEMNKPSSGTASN